MNDAPSGDGSTSKGPSSDADGLSPRSSEAPVVASSAGFAPRDEPSPETSTRSWMPATSWHAASAHGATTRTSRPARFMIASRDLSERAREPSPGVELVRVKDVRHLTSHMALRCPLRDGRNTRGHRSKDTFSGARRANETLAKSLDKRAASLCKLCRRRVWEARTRTGKVGYVGLASTPAPARRPFQPIERAVMESLRGKASLDYSWMREAVDSARECGTW